MIYEMMHIQTILGMTQDIGIALADLLRNYLKKAHIQYIISNPGVVVNTYNASIWKVKAGDPKLKVILSFLESSELAWDTQNPVQRNKQNFKK